MTRPDFEQELKRLVANVRLGMEGVMRESVQRLIEVAQTPVGAGGNLPLDSGFLRASLLLTTAVNPPIPRDRPPSAARTYSYDGSATSLAILAWDMRRPLRATYTANYARHVHYGAGGRAGRPWVNLAAQQWDQIVAQVARDVLQRRR